MYDHVFKVIIIGGSGVGKTSIMNKFADDQAPHKEHISTIGIDFKIRTIMVENQRVRLQIWDTAGQERFKTITTAYYRNSHGIILVYDITSIVSFQQLASWCTLIDKNVPNEIPRLLIGNKCDATIREVTQEMGQTFAKDHNMTFFETSAKTDINIAEVFEQIASKMIHRPSLQTIAECKIFVAKEVKKPKKKCTTS